MFLLAPKTRRLVDLFAEAEYGRVFSYAEILAETECDLMGEDRQRIYSAIRVLQRDHLRNLANVRGHGYRVAHPNEGVDLIEGRRRQAGRHLVKAQHVGSAVERRHLSDNESVMLSDAMEHLSRVDQMLRHHNDRLARIERHLGMEAQEPVEGTVEEE